MLEIANRIFGLFKVNVVHSLPGRVRVHVPLLARVSEELFHEHKERLIALILLKEGITDLSISYHSNKMLFTYNPENLREEELIEWLNHIWERAIEFYESIKHLPFHELDSRQEELYKNFKDDLIKLEG